MPINYKEYHPKFSLISRLVRFKRAGNKCEWCGVPNHTWIYRYDNGRKWDYMPEGHEADALALDGYKFTRIVLTTAHLDHNKHNNRFWNLAALCQKCHLGHDRNRHIDKRKYGAGKGQLKIL
jgi:hypothetical protein